MTTEAVRAANAAFYEAFQKLDYDAMVGLWAKHTDVSCIHPGWDLVVGFEQVMQSWRTIFDGSAEMRVRVDEPRLSLGSEQAWIVCREVVFTTVQSTPIENVLTATNVFVREDDQWRIAHHHAAPILTGRPRVSTPPSVLH